MKLYSSFRAARMLPRQSTDLRRATDADDAAAFCRIVRKMPAPRIIEFLARSQPMYFEGAWPRVDGFCLVARRQYRSLAPI